VQGNARVTEGKALCCVDYAPGLTDAPDLTSTIKNIHLYSSMRSDWTTGLHESLNSLWLLETAWQASSVVSPNYLDGRAIQVHKFPWPFGDGVASGLRMAAG
jgi:hypothetical protein